MNVPTRNLGHASAINGDPFRLGPGSKWHRYCRTRRGPGHAVCRGTIQPVGDDVQWAIETPRSNRCERCYSG